jgi:nicotinate-nucleotide adenylyltransferase
MNIGLLGGAFNPPHFGHLMIARQVLDFTNTDEVWFLPNFGQIPPKPVAKVSDRLAMTKLLSMPKTRVSTIEIDNALDGDTINLLPHLPKEHNFRFIIGSDQLPTFHLWGRWQELLAAMPFLVFPRYGFPNEPMYPNMTLVTNELLVGTNISSTKIRKRVEHGLSIEEFVPQSIASYVASHKLYR